MNPAMPSTVESPQCRFTRSSIPDTAALPSLDATIPKPEPERGIGSHNLSPASELSAGERCSDIETIRLRSITSELLASWKSIFKSAVGVGGVYLGGALLMGMGNLTVNPSPLIALAQGLAYGGLGIATFTAGIYSLVRVGLSLPPLVKSVVLLGMDPHPEAARSYRECRSELSVRPGWRRSASLAKIMTMEPEGSPLRVDAATAAYDIAREIPNADERCGLLARAAAHLDPTWKGCIVTQKTHSALIESIHALAEGDGANLSAETRVELLNLAAHAGDGRCPYPAGLANALLKVAPHFRSTDKIRILLGARGAAPPKSPERDSAEEIAIGVLSTIDNSELKFSWSEQFAALKGLELESRIGLAGLIESTRPQLDRETQIRADRLIREITPNSFDVDKRAKARLSGAASARA